MKSITTILVALVGAVAALVMTAIPAAAEEVSGSGACVTNAEVASVQDGQSKATVEDVFDNTGVEVFHGSGTLIKEYRMCEASGNEFVQVYYGRDKASGGRFEAYFYRVWTGSEWVEQA